MTQRTRDNKGHTPAALLLLPPAVCSQRSRRPGCGCEWGPGRSGTGGEGRRETEVAGRGPTREEQDVTAGCWDQLGWATPSSMGHLSCPSAVTEAAVPSSFGHSHWPRVLPREEPPCHFQPVLRCPTENPRVFSKHENGEHPGAMAGQQEHALRSPRNGPSRSQG